MDRPQLPNKDQIKETTDIALLKQWQELFADTAEKIHVDLTTILEPDPDWHCRARAALGHHRMSLGLIKRRIYILSRAPASTERNEAKRLKHEAFVAGQQANSVNRKNNAQNRALTLLEKTSYLGCLHLAVLDHPDNASIIDRAQEIFEERIKREMKDVGLPARAD